MMNAESESRRAEQGRILLAFDGSRQAFNALRYVARLCRPDRCRLKLFHVLARIPEEFMDIRSDPALWRELEEAGPYLSNRQGVVAGFMEEARKVAVECGMRGDLVSIGVEECEVGISRSIREEAHRGGYVAVVVGRHGRSEMKELVMGTTAERLLGRLTRLPVWVIGEEPQGAKVLLPMDNSGGALKAVKHAASILARSNAEVCLLFVDRSSYYGFPPMHPDVSAAWGKAPPGWDGTPGGVAATMQEVFARATEQLVKAGLQPERISSRIVEGQTSRSYAIVREARSGGFGTIVLGRRGLSRVEEFLMGRVSKKVLALATDIAVWVVD